MELIEYIHDWRKSSSICSKYSEKHSFTCQSCHTPYIEIIRVIPGIYTHKLNAFALTKF